MFFREGDQLGRCEDLVAHNARKQGRVLGVVEEPAGVVEQLADGNPVSVDQQAGQSL